MTLPWPSKALSPNARVHWRVKSEAAKICRRMAWAMASHERWIGVGNDLGADASPTVTITFQPPDNRRRDTDNMLASCKAYLDGIADAMGVDDSRWTLRIERVGAKAPGSVMVRVTA